MSKASKALAALPMTGASGANGSSESLGDLAAVMGDDYGHGVAAADDPNVEPRATTICVLSDITQTSMLATWVAAGQAVTKVTLQAVVVDKKKLDTAAAFAKFDKSAGSVTETVKSSADTATKTVLTGLQAGQAYAVRLLLTNPSGTVTCPTSSVVLTLDRDDDAVADPKKLALLQKAREKAEKEEAKKAEKLAKELEKTTLKRQKEFEKDTLKRMKKDGKSAPSSPAAAAEPAAKLPIKVNEAKLEAQVTGGLARRLTTGIVVEKPKDEAKAKLFEAPKGPQRSKIWEALNPQKLYYESRRDKEEREEAEEETAVVLNVRGGALGSGAVGAKMSDFSYARDEEGNIIQEEAEGGDDDAAEDDDYDPHNLPDFGDLQGVINEKRAQREKEAEAKRAALRAEHAKKKAAESAALDAERAIIKAKDAKLKAQYDFSDRDVKAAQARLGEVSFDFKWGGGGDETFGFD